MTSATSFICVIVFGVHFVLFTPLVLFFFLFFFFFVFPKGILGWEFGSDSTSS